YLEFRFKIGFIFFKITRDRIFARMSKSRITHIMAKARGGNYIMQTVLIEILCIFIEVISVVFENEISRSTSQTAAHRRNFKRVCEAVVHKNTSRQRKNLRFVL